MIYSHVKIVNGNFEFLPDSGYEYGGVVYGSQFLASSTDEFLSSIGLYRTILLPIPDNAKTTDGTMYFNKVGNIVEYRPNYIIYTAEEQMVQLVQKFTDVTTQYIEEKVQAYNLANGLAFANIDTFTKYAITPASVHNVIANQFIVYADSIWTAVRAYQSTITSVPSDEEFKAVLDSVVF